MKIAPLILASATALETASTAHNLLAAVGHRNATKMEALVQGLVEESISEPGWKFDQDIKDALEAIRSMFVLNIQKALKDQHKLDQEDLNEFTVTCFGNCNKDMCDGVDHCQSMQKKCDGIAHGHVHCRHEVKGLYIHMAQSCGALHSFIQGWTDEECTPEKCLCPDLLWCHRREGAYAECEARDQGCPSGYGSWLKRMIQKYTSGYAEWSHLYGECKTSYHAFLTADMACDATQKSFEQCMCEMNRCQQTTATVEHPACIAGCSASYKSKVKDSECLEKDRKIDWSATKKIECYVDILLHDYTKEELLSKCGSEDCINKAREEDYRHCHTICLEVDHQGEWPSITHMDLTCAGLGSPVVVDGHAKRAHSSQFLLGDDTFAFDMNGDAVFTMHRGLSTREGEERCTEHLDIDYPVPPCLTPPPPPPPVCDAAFHKNWYFQFDDTSRITEISDCCMKNDATCFADINIGSSSDGHAINYITVSEHSHAWAFNRCPCTECIMGYPAGPAQPVCGMGAHTLGGGAAYR